MSKRTERAMDCIENRRLKLEDTLPFSCTHCGGCCVHQEELLLNPLDLFRMVKELGITVEELLQQYGECYIGGDSRMPLVRIYPRGKTRRCPFLKNNKCSVHKAKPSVCRLYPLGRTVCYVPDEQGKLDMERSEVIYFHNGYFCGRQNGHQTVREWLEESHLLESESFFILWSQVVAETSMFLRKLEKMTTNQDLMFMVWDMMYMLLYIQYDTKKEFEPQFNRNLQQLRKNIAEIQRMGGF